MGRTVAVRLERKRKLFNKLRRLVPAVENGIDEAGEKSAHEMAATVRAFAPERSGRLKRATYAQRVPGKFAPVWRVAVDEGDGPTGENAFYGFWVEFSTVDTPAQPFFFPAYRITKKRHRGRVTRAINKQVRAIARK